MTSRKVLIPKTEVTLNDSDTEMPIRGVSKYPEVVLLSNEQPGGGAAVVNPGNFYVQLAEQEADLAELMTSLAATFNSPTNLCSLTQNEVENVVCIVALMNSGIV